MQMLQPVFKAGVCVYRYQPVTAVRTYCEEQLSTLWESIKRFENPQVYYVDLSQQLWDIRDRLIRESQDRL